MMIQDTVTITPGIACGQVVIPPSKSIAHRALICAALAGEGQVSMLCRMPYNEDIDATMDCLRALGVRMTETREPSGDTRQVVVYGCGGQWTKEGEPLSCRESGSTLRFMLPLCLMSDAPRTLMGSEKLLSRPLDDYRALLSGRGCTRTEDGLCLGGGATVRGGTFSLTGKSSSQFVTGLLFVLPLLGQDSVIELAAPPESRSYIDMTISVLARFGVRAAWQSDTRLFVPGGQTYLAADMDIDGDASGAAFFYALGRIGTQNNVNVVCPVSEDIKQGDVICSELLAIMAAATPDDLPVISLADCPDLGPMLFCAAAALQGAVFTHADRLRLKESDRVAAMVQELEAFGAVCTVCDGIDGGTVTILPPSEGLHAPATTLHGHNDHRIVMSLSVLSACLKDTTPVTIDDAHAIKKSFPDFFARLRRLGVSVVVN
ncbi:MAG: 3-phosphoshikimate 1-carboxyvinyltransferase [Ruminococcaceae bacterium]|nr:3-phosphoshikimate 1-carboxyvinyltransferase [Oscillospiraceae bacterium]